MFEKEIKFIVDYTLNKLRKEIAHINMGRLLNSSIHPAVIKYCSAEIDNQIRKDRTKLLTDSFFDYSGKEISKYFNLMTEQIRNNYKMKSDDLKKLVIKAVSFNANYVVRPGWTLLKFIYNEEKDKTIPDILSYFEYIYYYDYQVKVLAAFIQKRKTEAISKDEFIMIINKIDKEIIASNRKEILKDGVVSIAEFFNEGGLNKDKVAPYLVEYYLKDKKFTEALEVLQKMFPGENKQKQPLRDILARLSTALKEEIQIPEPEQTVTAQPETEDIPPMEEIAAPPHDETEVSHQESIPFSMEKEVETSESAFPEEIKEEAASDLKDEVIEQVPDIPEQYDEKISVVKVEEEPEELSPPPVGKPSKKEFSFRYYIREENKKEPVEDNGTETVSSGNVDQKNDIFNFLTKKEIDRIVGSVFNDDQDEFAATVDKIVECHSYNEASTVLKGVFKNFRINPYSKDAVMLTSAVASYFNQD